jgi:hypothetical protein
MAVELVDRLAILVAICRSLEGVLLTLVLCAMTAMSVCNISFVDLIMLFSAFLGDVWREFMQRLFVALHGTLGSYLRDGLQEGSADIVACLPVSWA